MLFGEHLHNSGEIGQPKEIAVFRVRKVVCECPTHKGFGHKKSVTVGHFR
jgi:hypothetical protein